MTNPEALEAPDHRAVLIVALGEGVGEVTAPRVTFRDGVVALYASAGAWDELGLKADITIVPPHPRADRRPLFRTRAGVLVEQDRDHRICTDGVLAWDEPLVAFGAPRSGRHSGLALGEEAALLTYSCSEGDWHRYRLGLSDPVLWVYGLAQCAAIVRINPTWLERARERLGISTVRQCEASS